MQKLDGLCERIGVGTGKGLATKGRKKRKGIVEVGSTTPFLLIKKKERILKSIG